MKKNIFIVSLLIILASCSGIRVVNVKYADKINKNYFIYALPKNIVVADIEITEIRTLRGPFYAYAEKYMGITGAPKSDKIEYYISNSDLSLASEADSGNYYFIFPKCKSNIKNVSLNSQNIILSINGQDQEQLSVSNNNILSKITTFDTKPFPQSVFTELSKNDYLKEHIDTVYKQIKVDTNWVRVPVQKKVIDTISFEGKAKEAAHHIMRLRKRLFKLISGAYNKLPDVNSADVIIKELKKEEEEYLSLFIGKTFTRTIHHRFYYTPSLGIENKKTISFLHPDKGIVADKSVKTLPVILEIEQTNNLSQLDTVISKYRKTSKNQGIVYRIPEMANIKLLLGNTLLIEKQLPIAQYGVINSLPSKILKGKKRSIEFDPLTGNIKKIE